MESGKRTTKKQEPLIDSATRQQLEKDFGQFRDPVTVVAVLSETENKPFNAYTRKILTELSGISSLIVPEFHGTDSVTAKTYGITRTPTILINPGKYSIRMTGAPAGEEARALLVALLMASTGSTFLSDASRKRLDDLREKRDVKVFVSPTCPYCPQQAAVAIAAAILKPELVSLDIIEIHENRDLATQYNAFSVPQVFIDERLVGLGLQPEEVFIEELISAAPVSITPHEGGETVEKDLVIIGAGPAGLTAAMYAARSGLTAVVVEKGNIGGQVAITPVVENYPGFTKIGGKALMDMMARQAIQYCEIHEGEEVLEIVKEDDRFTLTTSRANYRAKAVLFGTGAESKKLGIPGEQEFQGRGVSYCAACDGYFFKNGKTVIVVGGGNTAATEALYLKNIGVDVTIVHRRNELRAEAYLRQTLEQQKVPIIWDTVVREITGDKLVTGVVLEHVATKEQRTMTVNGVFIAIGYTPSSGLARALGAATDEEGYITADAGQRTTVPGIYAAGDITGGVKQIVTAVSQGAVAATTIFEDIAHPYWKR